MNISSVARKALIPIERAIKYEKIENCIILNNSGKLIEGNQGNNLRVDIPLYGLLEERLILSHNHPSGGPLSRTDIISGIRFNFREIRAISSNGRCQLVEIPEMSLMKKMKCFFVSFKYDYLFNKLKGKVPDSKKYWTLYRKMKKDFEKAGGLKFRTILLP